MTAQTLTDPGRVALRLTREAFETMGEELLDDDARSVLAYFLAEAAHEAGGGSTLSGSALIRAAERVEGSSVYFEALRAALAERFEPWRLRDEEAPATRSGDPVVSLDEFRARRSA